jgi:hypothetical protein
MVAFVLTVASRARRPTGGKQSRTVAQPVLAEVTLGAVCGRCDLVAAAAEVALQRSCRTMPVSFMHPRMKRHPLGPAGELTYPFWGQLQELLHDAGMGGQSGQQHFPLSGQ